MRITVVLAALAAIVLLPALAAQGDRNLEHVSPTFGPLAPGGTVEFHLRFENGSLVENWIFLVYGAAYAVDGPAATLRVLLLLENETVAAWSWTSETFHLNTTRLPRTSEYDLRLVNEGPARVSYVLYFDQSCDCLYKPIVLPGGSVLFNYEYPRKQKVDFGVPTVSGWSLRAALATREGEGGAWPDDFKILKAERFEGAGWLHVTWTAQPDVTYYVLVQALEGVAFTPDPSKNSFVEVTPLVERQNVPVPGAVGLLALAAAVLIVPRLATPAAPKTKPLKRRPQ